MEFNENLPIDPIPEFEPAADPVQEELFLREMLSRGANKVQVELIYVNNCLTITFM